MIDRIEQVASGIRERDLARMQELLAQLPDEASISEEALKVAAKNKWQGARMMEKLLDKRGAKIDITEDVVKAAAGNERIGKDVMIVLLEQRGSDIVITEEVVNAAAGNEDGGAVIKLLLEQRGADIVITEGVVKVAAGNSYNGDAIMKLLLEQRGADAVITEGMVKIIARKFGEEMIKFLLKQWGADVAITEEVVKIIASYGKETMNLLLEQRGADVVITEDVVKAVAGNQDGEAVMKLLLEQRGADVVITEDVMKAAAGNKDGGAVMKLLLEQRGADLVITEDVVKAAAGNRGGGAVMKLLRKQRGADMVIMEEVVKAGTGNKQTLTKIEIGQGSLAKQFRFLEMNEDLLHSVRYKTKPGLQTVKSNSQQTLEGSSSRVGESDKHVTAEQRKDSGSIEWPVEEKCRHNAVDVQKRAEVVDNPLEKSDHQASLGFSVPAEPQMRKFGQVQNSSLSDILHRLYLGVLRLLRPRLDVGQRRLEWKCNCGMSVYGDFRGDDEEIDKLVMEIQAHGFLVTQNSQRAKPLPPGSTQTTAPNSASLAPPRSNGSPATRSSYINTSQVVGGMPNTTANNIDRAASLSTSTGGRPKFVALCVNSGPFQKTYDEVDISSIPKSTQMFHDFKRAYEACRSSRINVIRSWLTKPVDINYIQFAVEGFKRVYLIPGSPDCTICAYMENKDDLVVMRRYERHSAASALAHPPIPSDLFFHLWECPGDITPALQTMWLNRLPKKIDEKLEKVCLGTRPEGEIVLGWGILVIEGIHKQRISRLTTAVVVLAIVISIAYSAEKKDVSSGFAIGALVIACWAVFITALYFEFQGS